MRATIMQPAYLPWLGYIQRAMCADVHIVLDHVKIDWHSKTQFTNRNKVLASNGPTWLTVPLATKSSSSLLIKELCINKQVAWTRKHWMTIAQSYAKAPFFSLHKEFFERFYIKEHRMLSDVLDNSTQYLLDAFGCKSEYIKSSSLHANGQKAELVLNLCREVGADTYISGPFGRNYLDLNAFKQAGIKVLFHDFIPFEYPQTRPGFVPFLSSVDMLFNVAPACLGDILSKNVALAAQ